MNTRAVNGKSFFYRSREIFVFIVHGISGALIAVQRGPLFREQLSWRCKKWLIYRHPAPAWMRQGTRIPYKKESVIYRDRLVPGTRMTPTISFQLVAASRASAARNTARKVIASSWANGEEREILLLVMVHRSLTPVSRGNFYEEFRIFFNRSLTIHKHSDLIYIYK